MLVHCESNDLSVTAKQTDHLSQQTRKKQGSLQGGKSSLDKLWKTMWGAKRSHWGFVLFFATSCFSLCLLKVLSCCRQQTNWVKKKALCYFWYTTKPLDTESKHWSSTFQIVLLPTEDLFVEGFPLGNNEEMSEKMYIIWRQHLVIFDPQ